MTKYKKYKVILFYLMLILIFISNNMVCYANDKFLDNSFWGTVEYTEKTIIESHFGSEIKISYNCCTTKNGDIGIHVDISPTFDSLDALCPKVSYYIHNNDNDISAILNYDSTITSDSNDLIKDYGINFSSFNNSYQILSCLKVSDLSKDSQLTIYVTIDNCRYMLLDNVSMYDYLYEEPTEASSDKDGSKSTTNERKGTSKDNNTAKKKDNEVTTAKSRKQSPKGNTKKGYYNNSSSKYSNQSLNNNYASNQQHQNDSASSFENDNDIDDAKKDNSNLSLPSKIAMISGSSIAVIGLTVLLTSTIFYRKSKDKE